MLLATTTLCTSAVAATPSDNERNALLALLDQQTAIATKTKLNADYVPGIVTVLEGSDLEARGYRSVWQALALVPGIDLFLDSTGRKRLSIRGISDTRYSGNVKIMLNSVAVNAAKDSMADPVLDLPIEQVQRIEVIRGPGSVVHGEYAYSGVINVVTRKEGRRAYATVGSNGTVGGGLLLSRNDPRQQWQVELNLAAAKSDGGREQTGPDALYNTTPSLAADSYALGPANTAQESGSAIFNLGYKGFALLAQWSADGGGDHYGVNSILPPPQNRIVTRNSYSAVTARQTLEPDTDWRVVLSLGWRATDESQSGLYLGPPQAFGGGPGPGIVLDSAYRESRVDGGMDLHWSGWQRHHLLLGLSHSEVRVDESSESINLDPATGLPSPAMNTFSTGVTPGTRRLIDAVMLQDEFRYSELFTLTTGLRYDHYSDAGSRLTPRIAGVWRLDRHNIVKAQYAQAFRPPDFNETRLGNDIRPSTIDTYEIGYIRKSEATETRCNLFYSKLSDLIVFDSTANRYINADRARTQGAELEQTQLLTPSISIDGNLSYADTEDSQTGQPIPGAVKWLANLGLTKRFTPDARLQLQYRYVGERQRELSDPRAALPGYQTIDATLTFNNAGYRGLTLRGGVKNLLDATVLYPSPMTTDNLGHPIVSYASDLPGPGRTWWLQLSYRY